MTLTECYYIIGLFCVRVTTQTYILFSSFLLQNHNIADGQEKNNLSIKKGNLKDEYISDNAQICRQPLVTDENGLKRKFLLNLQRISANK